MIHVTKANGTQEPFSEEKLLASIQRAGIQKDLHQKVLHHIHTHLYEGIPTHEIYHHVKEFLGHTATPYEKTKYSLKQAIMQLGPTGYPFEDYIAHIMQLEGYTTRTRQIVKGKCITHEIDVIAEKNTVIPTKVMVEAKFHNTLGIQTDVHVSLYTQARFEDSKDTNQFTHVWLVTNTKATLDAITYAQCVGMNVISWSYPEKGSLRDLVEKYQLYPITALETLPIAAAQKLLQKNIVLCKDICSNKGVIDDLGLDPQIKDKILEEASFVCGIKH